MVSVKMCCSCFFMVACELLAERIIPLLVSFGQSLDYTKCPNYMVWSSVLSVHFKLTVAELVLCWYWTCVLADSKLTRIQHWCLNNFWSIDCLNLQPYCLELWSKKTELMQVLGGADLVAVIFWSNYISTTVQWQKEHQFKKIMQEVWEPNNWYFVVF